MLEHEHRLIAKVLTVAQSRARNMVPAAAADELFWTELSRFAEEFVCRRHQAKEFKLFFCLQRQAHAQVTAFVGSLLTEHGQLAQLSKSLMISREMIKADAGNDHEFFAGHFARYIALIKKHMLEEDRFFRMVGGLVEPSEQFDLVAFFEKLDRETECRVGPWAQQVASVCV